MGRGAGWHRRQWRAPWKLLSARPGAPGPPGQAQGAGGPGLCSPAHPALLQELGCLWACPRHLPSLRSLPGGAAGAGPLCCLHWVHVVCGPHIQLWVSQRAGVSDAPSVLPEPGARTGLPQPGGVRGALPHEPTRAVERPGLSVGPALCPLGLAAGRWPLWLSWNPGLHVRPIPNGLVGCGGHP